LKADVEAAESAEALREVFREYVLNSADIDAARGAQDQWKSLDEDTMRAFTESLYMTNADSGKWIYLRGRIAPTPGEQIKIGRQLVASRPEWPWGYRLIVAAYEQHLFSGRPDNSFRDTLTTELPNDSWCFHAFRELEPTLPLAQTALFNYHVYQGAWDSAQVIYDEGRAAEGSWADDDRGMLLSAAHGRYAEALEMVSASVDTVIARGYLAPDRRQDTIRRYHTGTLHSARAYDELVRYLGALPGASNDPGILYDMACFSALGGERDQAFDYLEAAIEAGWDGLDHTRNDPDLVCLHGSPRWDELLGLLADAAAPVPSGSDDSSVNAPSRPAPAWALADAGGDTVRLEDLRGSVVVLDFFATWCGPCRKAMPALSRWVRESKPEGVHVFSIDVWETPFAKAQLLWESQGYGMRLLKGTDDLGKSHGFDGIPHICVIDKAGMIRTEYSGYSEDLDVKLARAVELLLQE
ncbi:TlpA family protein disulfide reductase, partial [Candidatus Fermentibacteria bacterium]|nr:TlpA family protein disulfide reductase [Candidatus Fermentibacteria bacterium]